MSEWTATTWRTDEKENVFKRLTTLETQVAKLVTLVDTLTDKLHEAGVLVQRKGK